MNELNRHIRLCWEISQRNKGHILHEYETVKRLYDVIAMCHAIRYAGPIRDILELRLLEEWLKIHHNEYIEAYRGVPYRRAKE